MSKQRCLDSSMAPWSQRFRLPPGHDVVMSEYDPASKAGVADKAAGAAALVEETERLKELQQVFYADSRQALLVVIQAMDTGGKDGAIRHVFGPLNPQGVRVTSFKQPTALELAHDYLWRIHAAVPAKGMVGIFNRSHYEDVLITRVHKLVAENDIKQRYRQINQFEQYLTENAVTILKFFLHISKDEQKERLEARLQNPRKHWKFSSGDLAERALWKEYVSAYENALSHCSTPASPWFVIPSDHKWYRNLVVARIVRETLEGMDLQFPEPEEGLTGITVR